MEARLLPCGERALLVEVADLDGVLALQAAVTARVELAAAGSVAPRAWADILDIVPAARTLLLAFGSTSSLSELRRDVALLAEDVVVGVAVSADEGHIVTIPVIYDGPDLDEVAERTGLSREQVVAAHTGATWRVAFGGFAPGFAYLAEGDERLDVPRRAEPRTKVPVGAVGLAGAFSGIYPRSSPGGWQLIGHTDEVLWDEYRDPPALLRPGWSVRFEVAS
ncbi:MAG: 5-oxoprolinase subunit PxpB [Micrococcales bacterium]|nr:5-oxoprolinase subunit PxpB [Micrococcales bacterium]